ncbi:protein amalgam-like isoform X2 [Amphibalanus amphitrite]|uniref:protein amalgam-like isoform X2 n=1 Tax=Amphibalanus amphitrite TaxID=1232801 RepID=UPI001C8FCD16|nr:protein amalgam-like isoform X2 [Amphibalanus amphitrite]
MMSRVVWLLLAAVLLEAAVAYPEDEYIFDEEAEETVSSHVPKFTSQPLDLAVKAGDTVTLPCRVDKLGDAVVVWRAGDQTLFTGDYKTTSDSRYSLQDPGQLGNSLVIAGVDQKDSPEYQCQISSSTPINLKHHVRIQVPPTITVRPESRIKVVEEGNEVVLECIASGFPVPIVTWTKKGDLLPYQEKKHTGKRLVIPAVKGAHVGDYFCTAENGVGDPATEHIRLEVNFPPQVEVDNDIVYTGAGHEAAVECNVKGQPLPVVSWFRVKGTPLDGPHYQQYQEGYRYGVRIASVRDEDLGVYNCQAENAIGKDTGIVHLTGKPKPVKVLSDPNGNDKDMFNIRWSVESYAEPIEYKILYRKIQEAGEPDQDWNELEVAYVAAPGRAEDSIVYSQKAMLKSLESAAVYQAIVTARNQYGWSEASDTFRFSTLGAKALISEKPSGNSAPSSLLRPAGVGLLSALLAAVVALL